MKDITKKQIALILILFLIAILLNLFVFKFIYNDNIKNAIWVKGDNMYDVNLDILSKNSFENVFLHSSAVDKYGSKEVEKWIKEANDKGIKVHIWVQCFYESGSWVNPINTTEKDFNYQFFDKKIAKIQEYAEIPGVSGIQLDYIRYFGNAYKYDIYSDDNPEITPSNAITKFVSMVNDKIPDNITLSATVMPERDGINYYGQDIEDLSWYVDVIVPMAYSGNYGQNSTWIKETTEYFKKEALWANVCIGIQNYGSDNNQSSLSPKHLKENCQAALDGGADGIGIFTWELMKWFNLNKLNY
ncbi:MAG: putative glycoside hydrolase [Methanobrevibacter sp.]|nr:putative glycoside hydrolase [Candidatus Methanoflexus mossambicus]